MKLKVHALDGDTNYFNIVAGVLQGDTLATYLFIICLDYILRIFVDKIKDNSFQLTKERSRSYPAQLQMQNTPMTQCFWQIPTTHHEDYPT